MSTQTKTPSQGLLFSEPSIAETGVWCSLNDGIDPAEWAGLCRFIGNMGEREFEVVKKAIMGSGDSSGSRLKALFKFAQSSIRAIPTYRQSKPKGVSKGQETNLS
jgi:hypothetical protein